MVWNTTSRADEKKSKVLRQRCVQGMSTIRANLGIRWLVSYRLGDYVGPAGRTAFEALARRRTGLYFYEMPRRKTPKKAGLNGRGGRPARRAHFEAAEKSSESVGEAIGRVSEFVFDRGRTVQSSEKDVKSL